ncbi:MAG: hypothetical protein GF364_12125 [Candidatus Lokiarchaeota archaeon]|nr:hypothetical protein [Candidatus Lokiarchaeota archaeon]
MDVYKLPNLKSAVLFDVGAMDPKSNPIVFRRYVLGFENFIHNNNVKKAYIRMPEHSNIKKTNFRMKLSYQPVSSILSEILGRKIKLLVVFGHVEQILQITKDHKIKRKIIVTDDDLSRFNLKFIKDDTRIIPSRILYYLYDAFWWRVTPFEMIEERFLQVAKLPDKSLNEFSIMGQQALKCIKTNLPDEALEILTNEMRLYPDQLEIQLGLVGYYGHELQTHSIDKDGKNFTDKAVETLLRMNSLFSSKSIINKQNEDYLSIIRQKMYLIMGMLLPYFNEHQLSELGSNFDFPDH